jgi:tRNA modification GTPase
MTNSTIAAIATPTGSGGIGIVKISGDNAFSIAGSIFQRGHSQECSSIGPDSWQTFTSFDSSKPHRLYYGHIIDPQSEQVLDEVLLAVMKAPHSYTREDVIEIQAHSGYIGLRAIMDVVLRQGARLAEPGEFTKRAFLKGRIDLTQAEAVIDVINAKTDTALAIATNQMGGKMKTSIESIKDSIVEILATVEAAIDFPDDVGNGVEIEHMLADMQARVIEPLHDLLQQYNSAHVLRDGLKVAVVGRPNVGKSSLMNCLIQNDRAIVTSIPGTTRDLIEETLNVQGIPVIITDTAGLHETNDPIEVIGISKAHESINQADLILFMIEAVSPITREDKQIYQKYQKRKMILVINKIDIVDDKERFDMPPSWNSCPQIRISALYNLGVDELKKLIVSNSIVDMNFDASNKIVPNLRHKIALEQSLAAMSNVARGLRSGTPFELIAIDIQEAIDRLGDIIGTNVREDILDHIFSRFCVGK